MSTKALLTALFNIYIYIYIYIYIFSSIKKKKKYTKAMKLLPQFTPKETMKSKEG